VITDLDNQQHEYLIPKDKHVLVHDGQVVNKGEMIVDGPVDPHDQLGCSGWKRSRATSSTKCRTSIACRA
jgi:DNA-directed RNA polymerase subunit beta'